MGLNTKKNYFSYTVVFLLFLLPRVFGLGTDISNSDALRWHNRSLNFSRALKEYNFVETYQRYHPGVTLMWVGAISDYTLKQFQKILGITPNSIGDADFYPVFHGYSKLLMVFTLAIFFAFQLFAITKVFGKRVAFIYGLLLPIEPYFIGINRWFHLSSLEVMFSINSLLYLLLYIKKQRVRYLILSAIFGGLGVLTKMTVLITVFFNVLIICYYIFKHEINFKQLLIYVFTGVFTFFLFFPAMWVQPLEVIYKMYTALFSAVTADSRGELLSQFQKIFYYPIILLFKVSPLVLIFGGFSLIRNAKSKDFPELTISIYFFFLFVFLTLSSQKIDRYSVALIPILILSLSLFLSRTKAIKIPIFILIQFVFFILASVMYYPTYSAYISPIFTHSFVLKSGFYENSGEYYSNAAFYLNNKGREIKTFIPNNVDSFKPYYKGEVVDSAELADYIVYGLDFDRREFTQYKNCGIEKYFGNLVYKPLTVYKCAKTIF